MAYEVYILRCEGNNIYTGIAKDASERFEKHRKGLGAKYTRMYKPVKIELVFSCGDRSEASKVEKFIKSKSKREKELYIEQPTFLEESILKSIKIKILQKNF
ncbi:MAG: GIY-YIG nuclease family protein [Fusobacterium sp.]|uniref:GIY-YIG nuclease family protein n=1 Tax=Fusobacterium sp. TaxID=68766 RepID=UPI0026DB6916|nr:GIY-YIG nuclease family protein [Fusobacterium sp.]MDO4690055.1 GIY-YIG nuclease family protein [Fusobacterium sp.]